MHEAGVASLFEWPTDQRVRVPTLASWEHEAIRMYLGTLWAGSNVVLAPP